MERKTELEMLTQDRKKKFQLTLLLNEDATHVCVSKVLINMKTQFSLPSVKL